MSIFPSIIDAVWKHWRGVALIALLIAGAIVGHAWYVALARPRRFSATLAAFAEADWTRRGERKGRATRSSRRNSRKSAALEKQVPDAEASARGVAGALPPLPAPITFSSAPDALSSAGAGIRGTRPSNG